MARRVIVLLGDPVITDEEAAIEAVTPGHFLEVTSTGVRKQTDDAANVEALIAVERDEMGKDIDVAYAIGDRVKAASLGVGHRAYAFIPSGQNVTKGDYLTSDATGCLTKTSVSATVRRARALETVNNSAGPGNARIRVVIV